MFIRDPNSPFEPLKDSGVKENETIFSFTSNRVLARPRVVTNFGCRVSSDSRGTRSFSSLTYFSTKFETTRSKTFGNGGSLLCLCNFRLQWQTLLKAGFSIKILRIDIEAMQ